MKFEVLKPFTFGEQLERGDIIDIPDSSTKIGSLTRSRFIRFVGDGPVVEKVEELTKPVVLPSAADVVAEMEKEQLVGKVDEAQPPAKSPAQIVRAAKEKAEAKVLTKSA